MSIGNTQDPFILPILLAATGIGEQLANYSCESVFLDISEGLIWKYLTMYGERLVGARNVQHIEQRCNVLEVGFTNRSHLHRKKKLG